MKTEIEFAGLVFAAALLFVVPSAAQDRLPGTDEDGLLVLAESDFLWDDDKWTTRGNASDFKHGNRMVQATDDGSDLWHFVAPDKFLGAKRAAYQGKLFLKHGWFEYNSEGRDVQKADFDVILFSEAYDLVIGYPNLFRPWEFRSEYTLDLVETGGWISNATGKPPSRPDMVRVVTKLSGIWIRGGFYYGHETSYLMAVKLKAGPVDSAPRPSSLKSQKIHSGFSRSVPPAGDEGSEEVKPSPDESANANDDDQTPPPPPPTDDDDLPPLDSDRDDPPKPQEKKRGGMFASMFGGGKKKGKDDEF